MDGGNADAGGLQLQMRCEQGFGGVEGRDGVGFGGAAADVGVGVDDGRELNGSAGGFEFAVDTEMIAAEGAGANDRYAGGSQ